MRGEHCSHIALHMWIRRNSFRLFVNCQQKPQQDEIRFLPDLPTLHLQYLHSCPFYLSPSFKALLDTYHKSVSNLNRVTSDIYIAQSIR